MPNVDTESLQWYLLDLSRRSDRRLLGRAVPENWPPPTEAIKEAITLDAHSEFEKQSACTDADDWRKRRSGVRNILLWARLFVAMSAREQLYDHGANPKHYRRWNWHRWHTRQRKDGSRRRLRGEGKEYEEPTIVRTCR